MHGKIVSYQSATGRGVIITVSKTLFEFNKKTWHDKRMIPTVGMYVEFRGESKYVSDAHASKFQVFDERTVITENDFWYTEDDEELETLEEKLRFAHIQKIFSSTNYTTIEEIQSVLSVADATKNYFFAENTAVEATDNLAHDDHMIVLNYIQLRRFITKALDSLLFSDKTIARDKFSEYLGILTRLENSYETMLKYQKINIENVFEDTFLKFQFHYQAFIASIQSHKEKLNLLKRQQQGFKNDVRIFLGRIETNRGDIEKNKEKLKKAQDSLSNIVIEYEKVEENLNRLENIKKDFYQKHFNAFSVVFQSTFNRFFKKIKEGLDHCGSLLDDQIWRLSANSTALKNYHFKNGAEENFCAINFALQYLSRLNKNMLHANDQELYTYCEKIQKATRKYMLIVSSNIELTTEIKVHALVRSKYLVVKHAPKMINLQSLLRDFSFGSIHVDQDVEWASTEDIIKEIESFSNNANAIIHQVSVQDALKGIRKG